MKRPGALPRWILTKSSLESWSDKINKARHFKDVIGFFKGLMAVGQSLRYLLGVGYLSFKGFWDVHRGTGVLTHCLIGLF